MPACVEVLISKYVVEKRVSTDVGWVEATRSREEAVTAAKRGLAVDGKPGEGFQVSTVGKLVFVRVICLSICAFIGDGNALEKCLDLFEVIVDGLVLLWVRVLMRIVTERRIGEAD